MTFTTGARGTSSFYFQVPCHRFSTSSLLWLTVGSSSLPSRGASMLVPEGATSEYRSAAVSKGTDAISFPCLADSGMVEGKRPLSMFKVLLHWADGQSNSPSLPVSEWKALHSRWWPKHSHITACPSHVKITFAH